MTETTPPGDPAQLFGLAFSNHRDGKLQEAEMLYRRILEIDPEHGDALQGLGLIAAQTGHAGDAVTLFQGAVQSDPKNPEYHNNLGMAYLNTDRTARAVKAFKEATLLAPGYAEAYFNLGVAEVKRHQLEAGAKAFESSLRLQPDSRNAAMNLARVLKELKRFKASRNVYSQLIASGTQGPLILRDAAEVAFEVGEYAEARDLARRAHEAEPDNPDWLGFYVHVLRVSGYPLQATQVLLEGQKRLLESHPDDPILLADHAEALAREERIEECQTYLQRAIEVDPDNPNWQFNLATVRLSLGDTSVVDDFVRVSESDQAAVAARAFYGIVDQTPKQNSGEEGAARLARVNAWLEKTEVPPAAKVSLLFAKGKLLEAQDDDDAAFEAYAAANAIRREHIPYTAAGQLAYVDRIRKAFDAPPIPEAPAGSARASARPVFVVGMPRSGTTLIEQILAAHPDVAGAGELFHFTQLVPHLPKRIGVGDQFPEGVSALDHATLEPLAAEYLDVLGNLNASAKRVVDKMPYNFLHVGLLRQMFPNARFVLTERTPEAIAWSIFTADFVGRHPYANALDSIGVAIRGQQILCDHWRAAFPEHTHTVRYETLVGDLEAETRSLLEFLDLPFDAACLAFHAQKSIVRTASAWQVRQPLYTSSRDRWRRFEQHLAPFQAALGAGGN